MIEEGNRRIWSTREREREIRSSSSLSLNYVVVLCLDIEVSNYATRKIYSLYSNQLLIFENEYSARTLKLFSSIIL